MLISKNDQKSEAITIFSFVPLKAQVNLENIYLLYLLIPVKSERQAEAGQFVSSSQGEDSML